MLPYQLTEGDQDIAALLRPTSLHINSNQSSVTSNVPVTASQIQGQGNHVSRDRGMISAAASAERDREHSRILGATNTTTDG